MLKNKNVLITGASKGIGAQLALKLADEGANLCLVSRSMDKSTELINELKKKNATYHIFNADMSQQNDIEKTYNYFKENAGPIDILINNSGRGIFCPITEESPSAIKEILDLNIFGLIYMTKVCTQDLIDQKGTVINISSVAGRKGFQGLSVYCASKWAVVGFSESLRDELCTKDVRVMTIEPGLVDTEWGENLPESFEKYKESVNMLKPEDIANTIVYALKQPEHVSLNEILIRPTNQPR